MGRISGEILIKRQVEQVFDYVADQRNEPIYNPQMLHSEKITDGTGQSWYAISRHGTVGAARDRDAHRGHRIPEAQQVWLADHDVHCRY